MLPKPHFHVTDANSPLESEGLPYVLDSFEQLAAPDVWERRQNELPYKTRVCVFPSRRGFRGCERIGDKGSSDPLSPIRSQLLQPGAQCEVNRSVHSHSFCRICPDRADRRWQAAG